MLGVGGLDEMITGAGRALGVVCSWHLCSGSRGEWGRETSSLARDEVGERKYMMRCRTRHFVNRGNPPGKTLPGWV
jgi:hypothetical protein